jgi:hypothetical protein
MGDVIDRNAAKIGASRVLAISNAHAPGEGSDAERDWEAWNVDPTGMLYDSREAAEDVDLRDEAALRAALEWCRGDSTWLDIDRLMAEVRDPRTEETMARRFYLNQLAASSDRAFDWERFATLTRPGYQVERGALITLGFDGAQRSDHTVLIGTEVATGYQWVVGYWEPRQTGPETWEVDVASVDATVEAAFERWEVWRMYADPYYWRAELAVWAGRFDRPGSPRVVEFNTTLHRRMAFALLDYRQAIDAGDVTHDGDERFIAAIRNAYRREQMFTDDNGARMWTIEKERRESPLKIDAAVAAVLSWRARLDAIASGALERRGGIVAYIPAPAGAAP